MIQFENPSKLLSGRYDYDSLYDNVGVFKQKRNDNLEIFLIKNNHWYITDDPLETGVYYNRCLRLVTEGYLKLT